MKNLLLGSILAMSVGAVLEMNTAQAQSIGKPASIGGVNFLANRFTELGISSQLNEMNRDGVTERSFVAVFNAKGAMIQNFELSGDSPDTNVGLDAGMQVLPYSISVTADGRTFISVAGFAMKNMNMAYKQVSSVDGGNYNDDLWSIVDNIQLLTFEWDKNFSVQGIQNFKLKAVTADAKLDILGSSKPGTFLAITGGGEIGWQRTSFEQNGQSTLISAGLESSRLGFYLQTRYGLEFNTDLGKFRLNARVGAQHNLFQGNGKSPVAMANYEVDFAEYEIAMAHYLNDKSDYEASQLNGTQISDSSYEALTGNVRPDSPKRPEDSVISRRSFILTPSLDLSTRISGEDKKPVRLGFNIHGALPIYDRVSGHGNTTDFTGFNREIVSAKLYLRF